MWKMWGTEAFTFSLALLFLVASAPISAQSGVKVELNEVVDSRLSNEIFGSLQLSLVLAGKDLDRAEAARVIVKEARDDRGNDLLADGGADFRGSADFRALEDTNGKLEIRLKNPPRQASSMQVKGTVELFVPARDANARVRVDKALAKLDVPLNSKGLRTAKIAVTPLSIQKYKENARASKLDESSIAELRERGKAEGASEEEITQMIGLIQALQELAGENVSDQAVVLRGSSKDFDRIHRVDVLGADGKPVSFSSTSKSSDGENTTMVFEPSVPLPSNPALRFTILTDKAKMSVPFDLKGVPLP